MTRSTLLLLATTLVGCPAPHDPGVDPDRVARPIRFVGRVTDP